nr:MAG TPA: formate dehydrogenase beta subunit-like protein [Caudoviricetes sp.]
MHLLDYCNTDDRSVLCCTWCGGCTDYAPC